MFVDTSQHLLHKSLDLFLRTNETLALLIFIFWFLLLLCQQPNFLAPFLSIYRHHRPNYTPCKPSSPKVCKLITTLHHLCILNYKWDYFLPCHLLILKNFSICPCSRLIYTFSLRCMLTCVIKINICFMWCGVWQSSRIKESKNLLLLLNYKINVVFYLTVVLEQLFLIQEQAYSNITTSHSCKKTRKIA